MKNILLIGSVLFLFLGCGKKNEAYDNKDAAKNQTMQVVGQKAGESNTSAPDSMLYEMKKFVKTYKGCKEDSENCSYLKMEYPVFSSGKSYNEINKFIYGFLADSIYNIEEGRPNKTLEALADNFLKDYETMKNEQPDRELGFALDLTGSVVYNKNNILTVDIGYYIFTGGAHPNSYEGYFVFNTDNGKLLHTKDIFVNGFESKLNKLIDKKYREFRGISDKERLDSEKGMLFENKISFNDNVGLLNDGVVFFYNSYEIAAYAVGQTELKFTYKELSDLLRPEFKK
ncbi:MAG: DUF3298 and DUF4163 domain-containing protein [Ignavibacteria bacterium]|nr:DUF3298 and DUF4163 domain-containing protein [Ignavibacteria bacterium]